MVATGKKWNIFSVTKLSEFITQVRHFVTKTWPCIPWTKPVEWNDVKPKELSPQGEIELYHYRIAKRFRSRFGQVFDKSYWNKYYKFVADALSSVFISPDLSDTNSFHQCCWSIMPVLTDCNSLFPTYLYHSVTSDWYNPNNPTDCSSLIPLLR